MKKNYILPFCICLFILGCSNSKEITGGIFVSTYDFTSFTKAGFLFTPESYSGEYESIGLIAVTNYPELKRNKPQETYDKDNYDRYVDDIGNGYIIKKINYRNSLNELYKKAVDLGANAVINLKLVSRDFDFGGFKYPVLQIEGFAIRRLQERK